MDLPDFAIEATGLVKTYAATRTTPEKTALNGIDLKIPRGSIFGLLGPNGAGKSTFINILAGLTRKTSGTAGMYGVPKKERRTDELLAALGLTDKADAYVRQLSGGMKRRLMVAKAMVHNPPVLILDEPTAGVDVELRRQLWNYVVGLNRLGVTIVLTTHYLEEAQELCDQIAIVNRGEVVACEPTATLLQRLDTRNVIVTPEEPVATAPDLTGFEAKLRSGGSFSVTYRTGQSSVEQVLAAVRASGLHIKDIATEDPDLEDVFLALTYGAADGKDPTKD
eukprot:gene40363-biopygen27153